MKVSKQCKKNCAELAFTQGTKAYKADKSHADNPYPNGSMQHSHWRTGFSDAEYRYLNGN